MNAMKEVTNDTYPQKKYEAVVDTYHLQMGEIIKGTAGMWGEPTRARLSHAFDSNLVKHASHTHKEKKK